MKKLTILCLTLLTSSVFAGTRDLADILDSFDNVTVLDTSMVEVRDMMQEYGVDFYISPYSSSAVTENTLAKALPQLKVCFLAVIGMDRKFLMKEVELFMDYGKAAAFKTSRSTFEVNLARVDAVTVQNCLNHIAQMTERN